MGEEKREVVRSREDEMEKRKVEVEKREGKGRWKRGRRWLAREEEITEEWQQLSETARTLRERRA